MSIYEIDPLCDSRWPEFIEQHPRASVFHTCAWLQALKSTYGYEPVAYTTTRPGESLANGWVFCRVRSWLTGRRLVSLPFSDHCNPLVQNSNDLSEITKALTFQWKKSQWRYIECRLASQQEIPEKFGQADEFCLHKLDLQPSLDELFRNLHKNSTQRKINRAAREQIAYEEGCSEALLDTFYELLVLTRQRHQIPPQPRKWFSSLLRCFGTQMRIRVAFCREAPIAAIITLQFKNSIVYKYGGANSRFFPLGGMQMLLWRAVREARESQLREFDLGRSDLEAKGLILFKDRLGATRTSLGYFRYPAGFDEPARHRARMLRRQRLLSYVPTPVITAGGRLLYKHFG
jgi:lipid II:glycine glycyltransferase (peptidoglycan interpeptide bridge formation enzyme)